MSQEEFNEYTQSDTEEYQKYAQSDTEEHAQSDTEEHAQSEHDEDSTLTPELFNTLKRKIDELERQLKRKKNGALSKNVSNPTKKKDPIKKKQRASILQQKQGSKVSSSIESSSVHLQQKHGLQASSSIRLPQASSSIRLQQKQETSSIRLQQKQGTSSNRLQQNKYPRTNYSADQSGIVKPAGTYIDIPATLFLTKEEFNIYKSNIRDLIEAYATTDTTWAKQEKRTTFKIIDKFKTNNPQFPKTIGDWAINLMIKRSINNKRAYQRSRDVTDDSDNDDHIDVTSTEGMGNRNNDDNSDNNENNNSDTRINPPDSNPGDSNPVDSNPCDSNPGDHNRQDPDDDDHQDKSNNQYVEIAIPGGGPFKLRADKSLLKSKNKSKKSKSK